ncbi:hypothetical protein M8J77_000872 [Diaphorina citri]|nr:hypothetical protein M8J77_000872 [Diaphorina citri]
MVLIVYGFPNDISALRFEWAWQHPKMSRRLQHVARKKSKETTYTYCLRLLHIMLQTAPWQRLPLTVQWLKPEYQQVLTEFPTLPKYMAMKMGPLDPKLVKPPKSHPQEPDSDDDPLCSLCHKPIEEVDKLTCPKCTMLAHMICLANYFLRGSGHYVPVDGKCVECAGYLRWGDLIEKN